MLAATQRPRLRTPGPWRGRRLESGRCLLPTWGWDDEDVRRGSGELPRDSTVAGRAVQTRPLSGKGRVQAASVSEKPQEPGVLGPRGLALLYHVLML